MPEPMTGVDRRHLCAFFALSLFAWVIWVPQAARHLGAGIWAPGMQSPLNALTVWSPGLAAMLLAGRAGGKAGVAALFRSLGVTRLPLRWYAAAILLEPARWALALGIDRLAGRTYELGPSLLTKTLGAAAFMIPVAVVFTLPNSLGEELGWRAWALPRLQRWRGPLLASVLLGLFWGFWHLPMWVAWGAGAPSAPSLLLMLVNMVPAAIVYTWLYNRTGGSLLIVCLFHAASANKGYFLPRLPTLTEAALLWVIAIVIVVAKGLRMPAAALSPESAPARLAGRTA